MSIKDILKEKGISDDVMNEIEAYHKKGIEKAIKGRFRKQDDMEQENLDKINNYEKLAQEIKEIKLKQEQDKDNALKSKYQENFEKAKNYFDKGLTFEEIDKLVLKVDENLPNLKESEKEDNNQQQKETKEEIDINKVLKDLDKFTT